MRPRLTGTQLHLIRQPGIAIRQPRDRARLPGLPRDPEPSTLTTEVEQRMGAAQGHRRGPLVPRRLLTTDLAMAPRLQPGVATPGVRAPRPRHTARPLQRLARAVTTPGDTLPGPVVHLTNTTPRRPEQNSAHPRQAPLTPRLPVHSTLPRPLLSTPRRRARGGRVAGAPTQLPRRQLGRRRQLRVALRTQVATSAHRLPRHMVAPLRRPRRAARGIRMMTEGEGTGDAARHVIFFWKEFREGITGLSWHRGIGTWI